jgi:hypothetical protein
MAKAAGKQLLPRPKATAPAADSTLFGPVLGSTATLSEDPRRKPQRWPERWSEVLSPSVRSNLPWSLYLLRASLLYLPSDQTIGISRAPFRGPA